MGGRDIHGWRRSGMKTREYADRIGVRYGTVKRWVSEGMPVVRDWSMGEGAMVEVLPDVADRWVARHHADSCAFDRSNAIYLARRADGAIKIGWTNNTTRRRTELQKKTRQLVELLCSWPGDKPDELALHARFAEHRLEGEWFRPAPELVAFVEEKRAAHGGASGGPSAVRADEGVRSDAEGRRVQGRRASSSA